MKSYLPLIDPEKETKRIASFIKKTLHNQKMSNVVIGMSGGIDSATSLSLVRRALPHANIFVAHLYHFNSQISELNQMYSRFMIPEQNQYVISIKKIVDTISSSLLKMDPIKDPLDKFRIGNIIARVRMIIIFDLAKKHNALVCGTENKSEQMLGYYTRFGDAASDIEPIQHLFKTQVYKLAKFLNVPETILKANPTAGLWEGQTDEGQFGFSYKEADQVLHLYFEKKQPLERLRNLGFFNASKIIDFAKKNSFKHKVPYLLG